MTIIDVCVNIFVKLLFVLVYSLCSIFYRRPDFKPSSSCSNRRIIILIVVGIVAVAAIAVPLGIVLPLVLEGSHQNGVHVFVILFTRLAEVRRSESLEEWERKKKIRKKRT